MVQAMKETELLADLPIRFSHAMELTIDQERLDAIVIAKPQVTHLLFSIAVVLDSSW